MDIIQPVYIKVILLLYTWYTSPVCIFRKTVLLEYCACMMGVCSVCVCVMSVCMCVWSIIGGLNAVSTDTYDFIKMYTVSVY